MTDVIPTTPPRPSKPMPAWVWAGLGLGLVLATTYYVLMHRSASP